MKLSKKDIADILNSSDKTAAEELYAEARRARDSESGRSIFAYGFVYFSTYCRNDCNFCYFRKSNRIERYRKSEEEAIALSRALVESGVDLIDLTTGEDPLYHAEDFATFEGIAARIKNELETPVMVSPGVVTIKTIENFKNAGADFYALYQETHDRDLFSRLRIDQSYDERMNAKLYARDLGMLIEEGLLAGVGETAEDIANSLETMGELRAAQLRVMSFVPQEGSPMENFPTPDREKELKIIALMRLLYPKVLIPASLDVDGISGLKDRINAGANLITSIIPPSSGLMGVAHSTMDVDSGGRTVSEAREILRGMGLDVASKEDYVKYLEDVFGYRAF